MGEGVRCRSAKAGKAELKAEPRLEETGERGGGGPCESRPGEEEWPMGLGTRGAGKA